MIGQLPNAPEGKRTVSFMCFDHKKDGEHNMGIIPPVNPIFYVFLFLAFLLLVLTLIALIKGKRTRRVKALFIICACCLLVVTIVYPIYLYSNKAAPLSSSSLLIGIGQNGRIVALNARDGSDRWTQSPGRSQTSITGSPGKVFYAASQTNDGYSQYSRQWYAGDSEIPCIRATSLTIIR